MRDIILTLINRTVKISPMGREEVSEVLREVFATLQSVKRAEFYESMKAGRQITRTFVTRTSNYEHEQFAEYEGVRYQIVRTYSAKNTEFIELNCAEVKI